MLFIVLGQQWSSMAHRGVTYIRLCWFGSGHWFVDNEIYIKYLQIYSLIFHLLRLLLFVSSQHSFRYQCSFSSLQPFAATVQDNPPAHYLKIPHYCDQVFPPFTAVHRILMGRNIQHVAPKCSPYCQTHFITFLILGS